MKRRLLLWSLPALCLAVQPIWGQIRPANAAGVSAGHQHLRVNDVDAHIKFWTAVGGETGQLGTQQIVKFPGVVFMFTRNAGRGGAPAPPLVGSEGSTVETIGFKVKDLKEAVAKWEAAGIKPLPGTTSKQAFIMAPDSIRVQVTEDAALSSRVATDE